jgi:hypothetical protein
MKRITGLTEDQAMTICAALPQYRSVRGATMSHAWVGEKVVFTVEVETYGAEETAGVPTIRVILA